MHPHRGRRAQGTGPLRKALGRDPAARPRACVDYAEPIEEVLTRLLPLLPEAPIAPRSLALMVLSGDETLSSG